MTAALTRKKAAEDGPLDGERIENCSSSTLTPQAKWANKNPKAVWAHASLRSAIRRGLIEREPCEVCGDPNTDGHHADYDKPLAVTWLCRKHHRAHHAKVRKVGSDA